MNNIDQAMQRNIDKYYLILILECDLNIDSKIYDVDRSSLSRERKNQLANTRLVFFSPFLHAEFRAPHSDGNLSYFLSCALSDRLLLSPSLKISSSEVSDSLRDSLTFCSQCA